eukprot:scaffold23735_cov122-Isochrysis_galbana.AAC.1
MLGPVTANSAGSSGLGKWSWVFGPWGRFQAALAGPSGPITAPGDEEREPRRPRALWLPICPRQHQRRDVPECRP